MSSWYDETSIKFQTVYLEIVLSLSENKSIVMATPGTLL